MMRLDEYDPATVIEMRHSEILSDLKEIILSGKVTDRLGRGKWLTKLEEYMAERFNHHYAVVYGGGTIELIRENIRFNKLQDVKIDGWWGDDNLPCWAIFTGDERSRDLLKQIRQHGYSWTEAYTYDLVGLGIRPSEMSACTTFHRLRNEDPQFFPVVNICLECYGRKMFEWSFIRFMREHRIHVWKGEKVKNCEFH